MSTPLLLAFAAVGLAWLAVRLRPRRGCCLDTAEPPTVWQCQIVSTLRDAEDLLDRLENCGTAERELEPLGNDRFAVRWR